jgi:hypothetical protein
MESKTQVFTQDAQQSSLLICSKEIQEFLKINQSLESFEHQKQTTLLANEDMLKKSQRSPECCILLKQTTIRREIGLNPMCQVVCFESQKGKVISK